MIDERAHAAATSPKNDLPEPTEAQKKAGNYKKGLIFLHGMRISIENPRGSVRKGKAKDGTEWESKLNNHYGYIRGTTGKDKDHIDVFLGPRARDPNMKVFVVDQVDPDSGEFDEHKVMLGFKDADSAADAYRSNYSDEWGGMGAITPMPLSSFKKWAFQEGPRTRSLSGEIKHYANGGRVVAAAQPVHKEACGCQACGNKFADGGAVQPHLAGFYPHLGRRKPENNDRVGSAEVPLNLLRGTAAQALGMFGDVEDIGRMALNGLGDMQVEETPKLPTTEFFLDWLTGKPQTSRGKTAEEWGALWLPLASMGPAAVRGAAKYGPGAVRGTYRLGRDALQGAAGNFRGALSDTWSASRGYADGGDVDPTAGEAEAQAGAAAVAASNASANQAAIEAAEAAARAGTDINGNPTNYGSDDPSQEDSTNNLGLGTSGLAGGAAQVEEPNGFRAFLDKIAPFAAMVPGPIGALARAYGLVSGLVDGKVAGIAGLAGGQLGGAAGAAIGSLAGKAIDKGGLSALTAGDLVSGGMQVAGVPGGGLVGGLLDRSGAVSLGALGQNVRGGSLQDGPVNGEPNTVTPANPLEPSNDALAAAGYNPRSSNQNFAASMLGGRYTGVPA